MGIYSTLLKHSDVQPQLLSLIRSKEMRVILYYSIIHISWKSTLHRYHMHVRTTLLTKFTQVRFPMSRGLCNISRVRSKTRCPVIYWTVHVVPCQTFHASINRLKMNASRYFGLPYDHGLSCAVL